MQITVWFRIFVKSWNYLINYLLQATSGRKLDFKGQPYYAHSISTNRITLLHPNWLNEDFFQTKYLFKNSTLRLEWGRWIENTIPWQYLGIWIAKDPMIPHSSCIYHKSNTYTDSSWRYNAFDSFIIFYIFLFSHYIVFFKMWKVFNIDIEKAASKNKNLIFMWINCGLLI